MIDSQEHTRLLDAVRAAMDDDRPRLAYAEWLEQSGRAELRARAELIRVQLALAADPEDAPALHARELELLARHGREWMPAHPALQRVRFRRGFIEYAHLHLTHYLHHRRQLRRRAPLRALSLTGWNRCSPSLVERVAACAELQDIESLAIHHQGPHKHPRGEVATLLESPHLRSLVELSLPMMELSRATRHRIERCALLRRVRRLHLGSPYTLLNETGEWLEDGAEAVEQWSELRWLDLAGGFGTSAKTVRALAETGAWRRLHGLAVELPTFERDLPEALGAALPPDLRELTLRGEWVLYEHGRSLPDALTTAIGARPLESLTLHGLPVSAPQLGSCLRPTLRRLTLEGDELSEAKAGVLASLELRDLVIRDCRITDAAASTLFRSPTLSGVTSLDLGDTSLSARGLEALAASPIRALRYLCLTLDDADREGVHRLLESPVARSLVWLRLKDSFRREPALTSALAERLACLPHLRGFTLPLSALSAEEIARALPRVAFPIVLRCDWKSVLDSYPDHRPGRWPPIDVAMERYRASKWM